MANRFGQMKTLDGARIIEDMRKVGVNQSAFAQSLQLAPATLRNAVEGKPVSQTTAERIARGLFKEPNYYDKAEEPFIEKPNTNLNELLMLLEDIKQEQIDTVKAIKTLTTITARMLAIWEGERHENNEKGNDSSSH